MPLYTSGPVCCAELSHGWPVPPALPRAPTNSAACLLPPPLSPEGAEPATFTHPHLGRQGERAGLLEGPGSRAQHLNAEVHCGEGQGRVQKDIPSEKALNGTLCLNIKSRTEPIRVLAEVGDKNSSFLRSNLFLHACAGSAGAAMNSGPDRAHGAGLGT